MKKYDVIIIGGGPAGMTAAVYASRANLTTIFIEKGAPGGKMVKTSKIENWTGDKSITGPDLSLRMFDHAKAFGAKYKYGDVVNIKTKHQQNHIVILASGEEITGRSVVIATGMVEKVPEDIEGIYDYEHKGVSYCAICDGPLYKNLPMAVIGGGNSAIEEALYLSHIAKTLKVFVRNKIKAEPKILAELKSKKNVEIFLKSKIKKITGNNKVEKVSVTTPEGIKEFNVRAIFPYIGQSPVSDFAREIGITNKNGFIKTNHLMETKIKGIFAIGDIRDKDIRQITTAVSDGAIAGKMIANEL